MIVNYKHGATINRKAFIEASDEQVERFWAELNELDAYNKELYDQVSEQYKTLLRLAVDLYGPRSNVSKYLQRSDNKPPKPPHLQSRFDNLMLDRKAKQKAAAEAESERRRKLEADNARRSLIATTAIIAVKYDQSPTIDTYELVECWRKMDKYFDLALAMELTRGDWSDGYYRVSQALSRFEIESEQDREIHDDILDCFECEDGRVFRDTTWNYNRLYSELVDPKIWSDYEALSSELAFSLYY